MIKKNIISLLWILLLLLIQVHCNNATTMTQDYIIRDVDISGSSKNILIGSSIGGRSLLKPMLDLAAVLIERGHNVILLTLGNYSPSSEYPTIKQISLGPALILREIYDLKDMEIDYNIAIITIKINMESYKPYLEKYLNVSKEYDIDLFLCDCNLNDACLDTAHFLKKPIVKFGSHASTLAPTTYKSDPLLFGCSISLENESILERFRCTIIQPLRKLYMFYPLINQFNNLKKQIHAELGITNMGNNAPKAALTLIDSFFGYELPQSLPPNIQEIGPVLPKEYEPLTPELSDFINAHERVLYVAFGGRFYTSTKVNCKLLQSFLEAINKNLIDGVVWPLSEVRKDEFCPTLNLSDGSQIQTSSILNNEHSHIYIMKFAPQLAVLKHNNTKLFLSHTGTSSVYESLYAGTPILALPLAVDQHGNAEKLLLCGVSLTLDKNNLNVDDILNKINFLLKDENVKKNSKRMEALAKISSKRKYRAADSIEYILYSHSLDDKKEEFLSEWVPADVRMGFIRGKHLDIYVISLAAALGLFGGILWVMLKLIRLIAKRLLSSVNKFKNE